MQFLLFFLLPFSLFSSAPLIIGICGGTCSGKTTLVNEIARSLPGQLLVISQDNYYKDFSHLPLEQRHQVNFDHPDSIEFSLLYQNLLDLKAGKTVSQPNFDFPTHTRLAKKNLLSPQKVIIVEGILIFAVEEIRELCDLKIFAKCPDDTRLLRRIERDIAERGRTFEHVKEQYVKTVAPMHRKYIEPSKRHADLIVCTDGETSAARDVLTAKIQNALTAYKN